MSSWLKALSLADIPVLGSRIVILGEETIAIFRGRDDVVYAIKDACPHKGGPLSQGIMHGHSVTCPLHNWKIDLTNGQALGPDEGCANVYQTKIDNGFVYLMSNGAEAAA
jgi:nitrite reductase (NADH) small subunit